MLEIGSLVDGKYKILNEVGRGGMSVVYLAMNEKANKRLQEAMPLFESCLKKGDSGVTMADLGFTKYNFSN